MLTVFEISSNLSMRQVEIRPEHYKIFKIPLGMHKTEIQEWIYHNTTGAFYLQWDCIAFELEKDAMWFKLTFSDRKIS